MMRARGSAATILWVLLAASASFVCDAQQAPSVEMQTLTYASRDGRDLLLDLYLPQTPIRKPAPVIVFLHGGGWSGGTRTTGPDFKRYFAADGFAIASIEYRLTPAVTFPAPVEDVRTAVRWLKANAVAHAIDPDRICLWGTSAGGHLAAVAALAPKGTFDGTDNLDRSSDVRCVLDAYGPTKFDVMDEQAKQEEAGLQPPVVIVMAGRGGARPGGAPTVPPAMLHNPESSPESRLIGAAIQTAPERVRAASPITYVRSGAPPFLLMHGLADNSVPHGQSVLLYEALVAAGNDATLRLVDGLPHTFFNRTDLDDVAGPFRMDVREHRRGGTESRRVDRAGVFAVARDFFLAHLR